ncbi:hypothetical protein TNCV_265101 [Trichonephila clavipes]|nr:hypothetical protein TNCV_265101 [Trichonephila clavipes]
MLEEVAIEIENIYENPKSRYYPLLNQKGNCMRDNAKNYYVCDQTFRKNNTKVRDHNHVTQKINGPCCNSCNLAMKTSNRLLVFFHNLSGHRGSLVVKVMDSWPACHKFESSTSEDLLCRASNLLRAQTSSR